MRSLKNNISSPTRNRVKPSEGSVELVKLKFDSGNLRQYSRCFPENMNVETRSSHAQDGNPLALKHADAIQSVNLEITESLSPQKWLRGGVHFVDSIPKTPSGKIQRMKLQLSTMSKH